MQDYEEKAEQTAKLLQLLQTNDAFRQAYESHHGTKSVENLQLLVQNRKFIATREELNAMTDEEYARHRRGMLEAVSADTRARSVR